MAVDTLVKAFGGLVAVDGASFDVGRGSITGLIGPNGAGKTTLFNVIAGALQPTSGHVYFDGADITGLATYELYHRGVVRSFQLPKEYGRLTVLENLMVAPLDQPGENIFSIWFSPAKVRAREREVVARAEEALEFLGMTRLRDELAMNLSGGQKKLLELGRAMMTDSKLVLLDEPGAGVNPTLMNKIVEMIERLNRERSLTFCIIEHDMDLIERLCDPVIVLADGKVLTQGSMDEVRSDARVIDAYFGGDVA
ncbi:MAG: ABC transporter ATP-binding protein [Gammaproteobacteria bacterium]